MKRVNLTHVAAHSLLDFIGKVEFFVDRVELAAWIETQRKGAWKDGDFSHVRFLAAARCFVESVESEEEGGSDV